MPGLTAELQSVASHLTCRMLEVPQSVGAQNIESSGTTGICMRTTTDESKRQASSKHGAEQPSRRQLWQTHVHGNKQPLPTDFSCGSRRDGAGEGAKLTPESPHLYSEGPCEKALQMPGHM